MSSVVLGPFFDQPLHRASWSRELAPAAEKDDYRVTNPYDGPDLINGGIHEATDVGDGTGQPQPFLAPLSCRARGLLHFDGARGIELELSARVRIKAWHLSQMISSAWQAVVRGSRIGSTGNSGRQPMPYHTHLELWIDGRRVDIEPHLFGAPLSLLNSEEGLMRIPGRFLRHVQNRRGAITIDAHLREGVIAGADASIGTLKAGAILYPVWVVEGRAVGTAPDKAEWYGAAAYLDGAYQSGFVHSSVLPRTPDQAGVALEAIEVVSVSVDAYERRLDSISTAADGAAQAIATIQRTASG